MLTLEGEDAVRFWDEHDKPPSPEVQKMFDAAKEMFKRIRWE